MADIEISEKGIKISYRRFLTDSAPGLILFGWLILWYKFDMLGGQSLQTRFQIANGAQHFFGLSESSIVIVGFIALALATPLGLLMNVLSWFALGWIQYGMCRIWWNCLRGQNTRSLIATTTIGLADQAILAFNISNKLPTESSSLFAIIWNWLSGKSGDKFRPLNLLKNFFEFFRLSHGREPDPITLQFLLQPILQAKHPSSYESIDLIKAISILTRAIAFMGCVYSGALMVVGVGWVAHPETSITILMFSLALLMFSSLVKFYEGVETITQAYLLTLTAKDTEEGTWQDLASESMKKSYRKLLTWKPETEKPAPTLQIISDAAVVGLTKEVVDDWQEAQRILIEDLRELVKALKP